MVLRVDPATGPGAGPHGRVPLSAGALTGAVVRCLHAVLACGPAEPPGSVAREVHEHALAVRPGARPEPVTVAAPECVGQPDRTAGRPAVDKSGVRQVEMEVQGPVAGAVKVRGAPLRANRSLRRLAGGVVATLMNRGEYLADSPGQLLKPPRLLNAQGRAQRVRVAKRTLGAAA